jgi:two-component system, NtrC family, response regulator AtoC
MGKPSVLVVDDDESIRRYLALLLSSLGYDVDAVESGEQALGHLGSARAPAVVLLDLLLPGMGGLQVLDQLKQSHPEVPVIVLSTVAQVRTAMDAVRRGAGEYLTKPFEPHELKLALHNVLEQRDQREDVPLLRRPVDQGGAVKFVSSSPRVVRIKEIARQVADTDVPVLLLGESGVGKEVLARFIHEQSRRRRQPFVKINCAALPQDLLESELFGYERGAFSGAFREKPGMFELADKGSILLDEIGEMTPHLQAKLLHVLQDGEYTRLGGRHRVNVDARVLAATNIRLEEAVAAGRFRPDLYYRLNVIRLEIPPLRERREDIPLLLSHFLKPCAARYNSAVRELPPLLREAFLRYDWPGNVRELENAVRRYVILPDLEMALAEITKTAAPAAEAGLARPRKETSFRPEAASRDLSLRGVGAEAAAEAEQRLLRRVLAETRWNRKEAASQLQISYKALLNKLKKWEVDEPAGTPGRRRDRAPASVERFPSPAEPSLAGASGG